MFKNKRLRLAVTLVLILGWFGFASLGGPTFGKISEVSSNEQASFLPASAESTQVQQLQRKFENGQAIPAVVVIESTDKLSPEAVRDFAVLQKKLADVAHVQGPVIGPIPSKDFKALEFIVPVKSQSELKDVVGELRGVAQKDLPQNTQAYVTGPAGLNADLVGAFGGVDGILLTVALTAVFIILVVVYRSVLLPVLVLLNAVFALSAAILVVYILAKNDVIQLNGQSQGILSILVIGAATDYSLLLVARYREALSKVATRWEAIQQGIKGSFEPILASAATVVLALLCLLFSDLNSNRSLGPIAATGIAFSFLATLTFLPALLALFGRAAFLPSKIAANPSSKAAKIRTGHEDLTGIWKRVGGVVATRSRQLWVGIVVVLLVCSFGLMQLKANGVPRTELVLSESNAAEGQKAIARHFDAGAGSPVLVTVPQEALGAAVETLQADKKLADIMVYGERGPSSNIDGAKTIDGKMLLSATLTVDPYSDEAEVVIQDLRREFADRDGVLVGGTTAITVDTTATAKRDLKVIVPLVLVMIFVVLALLLRALLAPLLLILTVVLSFAAALGISAFVFNHIFSFPGAEAAVPLFGFVFLVALGIDYNIFLVTRTREEVLKYGTRPAILHSLGKTGGVITSAGIVLAATFAALGVIPILFLAQLAFIVAFGVLLDALVVRSLLVPALFYDIDSKVWWPSRKITK